MKSNERNLWKINKKNLWRGQQKETKTCEGDNKKKKWELVKGITKEEKTEIKKRKLIKSKS